MYHIWLWCVIGVHSAVPEIQHWWYLEKHCQFRFQAKSIINLFNWGRLGSESVSLILIGFLSSPLFIMNCFWKSRVCSTSIVLHKSSGAEYLKCVTFLFAWQCICMAPHCILMPFDCQPCCAQSGHACEQWLHHSVYFCVPFHLTSTLIWFGPLSYIWSSVLSFNGLQNDLSQFSQ